MSSIPEKEPAPATPVFGAADAASRRASPHSTAPTLCDYGVSERVKAAPAGTTARINPPPRPTRPTVEVPYLPATSTELATLCPSFSSNETEGSVAGAMNVAKRNMLILLGMDR